MTCACYTAPFRHVAGMAYEVAHPFTWNIGGKLSPRPFLIPRGYRFDSSVPRLLRWILSPHNPYFLLAACVHDFALEQGQSRLQAAGEWLDGARAAGAPKWTTQFAALAVAFGAIFLKGKKGTSNE